MEVMTGATPLEEMVWVVQIDVPSETPCRVTSEMTSRVVVVSRE